MPRTSYVYGARIPRGPIGEDLRGYKDRAEDQGQVLAKLAEHGHSPVIEAALKEVIDIPTASDEPDFEVDVTIPAVQAEQQVA